MNSFRVNVLLRVLLLATLCAALAWSVTNTSWLITPLVCSALLVLAVVELLHYVERVARDLERFLVYVAHHDFSTPLVGAHQGRVFEWLQDAYKVLATEFRRLNLQKAANHEYLETVVDHVGVALACFDAHENVTMLNEPARRLFGVPHLASLRGFKRIDARLPQLLLSLDDGERALLEVRRGEETLQLVLYATTFELLGRSQKLVSFQNIRDELERQEIESGQKLIRVLTHEIMNSVTPIISLSRLIHDTLVDEGSAATPRQLTPRDQEDLVRAVAAIHARSNGLFEFVQAYRSFAALPAPVLAAVEVAALFSRAARLVSQDLAARGIPLDIQCDEPQLAIRADARQIEQVLLNLLRNAVDALVEAPAERAPRIVLHATRDARLGALLSVSDNGPGIDPAHADDIFVPFFSTRRNGTGVGLSISRQIVQRNRGFISVRSSPGDGCTFTLRFP